MPNWVTEESKMRMTTFSPNKVGSVLTRKSISRPSRIRSFIRPSCGTRFSEISSRASTLMREASFSLI